MEHQIVNVLDHGADPGGVNESTEAFREALRLSRRIEVPRGVYEDGVHSQPLAFLTSRPTHLSRASMG